MAGPETNDEQAAEANPGEGSEHNEPHRASNVVAFPSVAHDTGDSHRRPDDLRLRHVIGETLREERRRQGRTLADVADEAAVSLPYLSEIERGQKEVSSDVLHSVHRALGLELDQVLERAALRLRVGVQHRGPMLLAA